MKRLTKCLSCIRASAASFVMLVTMHSAAAQSPVRPLGALGYGSLKTDRVELRPSAKADKINLVFRRAGLPVRILEAQGSWLRIEDADNTTGWVAAELVSRRRTGLMRIGFAQGGDAPATLRASGDPRIAVRTTGRLGGGIVAYLEPGVIVGLVTCDGSVCEVVAAEGIRGRVDQVSVWGVDTGERF